MWEFEWISSLQIGWRCLHVPKDFQSFELFEASDCIKGTRPSFVEWLLNSVLFLFFFLKGGNARIWCWKCKLSVYRRSIAAYYVEMITATMNGLGKIDKFTTALERVELNKKKNKWLHLYSQPNTATLYIFPNGVVDSWPSFRHRTCLTRSCRRVPFYIIRNI